VQIIEQTADLENVAILRFHGYHEHLQKFDGVQPKDTLDQNDRREDTELYIARDKKNGGELIGSFRLNTATPLPHTYYWPEEEQRAYAMEMSRLVIAPRVNKLLDRYELLYAFIKLATQRAFRLDVSHIYTTAVDPLAGSYVKLMGFEHSGFGPRAVYPVVEKKVHLLRLPFTDEVQKRATRIFKL
jgi:hypothetical protein